MTEISFYFNVPDRADYACRLLRKAVGLGARIVVSAAPPLLARIDQLLWTFDPLAFIPHVLAKPGQTLPTRLHATPIWLSADASEAARSGGHHEVLLNLHEDAPLGFESFERLIEIVSTDPQDRQAARQRWKHYETRGYAIEQHKVATT